MELMVPEVLSKVKVVAVATVMVGLRLKTLAVVPEAMVKADDRVAVPVLARLK